MYGLKFYGQSIPITTNWLHPLWDVWVEIKLTYNKETVCVKLHSLWDVWVEISVHQFAYTRYLCYIHYGMYGLKLLSKRI